jgi:ABC-2 type transport system ATP-binding protein
VEDIDSLRKKQLKKVYIEFGEPINIENFNISGVEKLNPVPGNVLSFLYSGNINELISFISEKKIINLVIEEPSLDEIFMHYYKI